MIFLKYIPYISYNISKIGKELKTIYTIINYIWLLLNQIKVFAYFLKGINVLIFNRPPDTRVFAHILNVCFFTEKYRCKS